MKKRQWLKEWLTPHEQHCHEIKKVLVNKKTKFQNATILDTYSFGRCLILDGEMQSSQLDEFIYHEALVHPSFLTHPNPKTAVILGGGEGATLREILKYKSIEKVTMVDIDGEVVDFCKKYLKSWHQNSFADKRVELIVGDAKIFIEESPQKFDIILSDLPSPAEGGPATALYTLEFYKALRTKLNKDGIFVTQAGSGSLIQIELHSKLYRTLTKAFSMVRSYSHTIPSYDVPWSYLLCAQSHQCDPIKISTEEVDHRIQQRITGSLSFYDGMTHTGLFNISKNLRGLLKKEKEVITLKTHE